MWFFSKRGPLREGFPEDFKVQRVWSADAEKLAGLPTAAVADYFREHPEQAKTILLESYDKRYSPSTFIEEAGGGFNVGWYSRKSGRQCVKIFNNLSDAATDYLLFSRGVCRWDPTKSDEGPC